jgi:hypothetical protein
MMKILTQKMSGAQGWQGNPEESEIKAAGTI